MGREWSIAELVTTAEALVRAGEGERMLALYREWIDGNGDDPFLYLVQYNRGVSLSAVGDPHGAREAYQEALRLNPDFLPTYINLGNVLEHLVSPDAAAACWRQLVARLPQINPDWLEYRNSACKQIGRVADSAEVEWALRIALDLNPRQHDAIEHWISARQQQCQWPVVEPFPRCSKAHLMTGFAPLSLAAYSDDPVLQLANAALYNQKEIRQAPIHFLDAHAALRVAPAPRPRVGYLSSDLRLHAIGFLMVELFERHDPEQVDLYFYYTGQPVEDPIHRRIRAVAPRWRDLHALSDEDAARQILADRIEILVDVNGYTLLARLKLLSMRPAPVIVNWLGYPGTMGSPYHHYVIADSFVIPPENEIFYSEKVVRLPCYQPNDSRRRVAPHRPTRAAMGLPESGVVFCCFNGVRKITAVTWDLWCQVLHRVPGSVMWLLHENDSARNRLRELAVERGIDPDRLVFAPLLINEEHLARYPLVDLVLDCFPYGAHTTASDALWMGVPILTLAGLSFASRVCGSLVRAAGLGELVCATGEEYVARAVELGTHPELLQGLRARLEAQRHQCVLFDMTTLARRLEGLFVAMREDFLADRVPRPDLTNLEVYQEIGIGLDPEAGGWRGSRAGLIAAYEQGLASRDRLCHLGSDRRLWTDETRVRFQPGADFHETIGALDEARDLEGLIACAGGGAFTIGEKMEAIPGLLRGGRVLAAYIVAMMLANGGAFSPGIAMALWAGGIVFGNTQEEERGILAWQGLMAGMGEGERSGLRVQVEALMAWVALHVPVVTPERLGRLLVTF
ncbi:MAG: tetratricopeptide repeat protein [Magnetococcales bacterium]|nr:tetratricopeptide repeat protein [Magnetococcales bacterium]